MTQRPPRLAALWFADIAGYTELTTKDEDHAVTAGLANLGRTDEALDLLEKVVNERHAIAIQIGVQPSFGVLRQEPRFQALLKRVGVG